MKISEVKQFRDNLAKEQDYKCAVCGVDLLVKGMCLDHDHSTGRIRGVLCRNCNRGEGKVRTVATMCKRDGSATKWIANLLMYLCKEPREELHPSHRTEEEKREHRNRMARNRRKKT